MNTDVYFCLKLTENEHHIIEEDLRTICLYEDLELIYYRKLKEGHIPMYREAKLKGNIWLVEKYVEQQKLEVHMEKNPWRT